MLALTYCVARFEENAKSVASAAAVNDEQAKWKPSSQEWSILEVVNHLFDEERDDFRRRLDMTLHYPGSTWPPIDPEKWAVDRRYNERELEPSLENFLAERAKSLEWLRSLATPDWTRSYFIPEIGRMTAGDLLASWLAHDYLHLRQLAQLHWQYTTQLAHPYSTGYAGRW